MGTRQQRRLRSRSTIVVAASVLAGPLVVQFPLNPAMAAAGSTLSVNVAAARHAISPGIYGLNGGDAAFAAEIGVPVSRWGGNTSSRYNYMNHTYNTGSDWYFENIVAGADGTVESFAQNNVNRKVKSIVAVPMVGWVSKDSPSSHPFACGFPATRFPQQESFDQWDSNCGNGKLDGKDLTADPSDTSIKVDPASFDGDMVKHLVSEFGTAAHGGVSIYELDNEPMLWSSTHRDVHPQAVTYDELGTKGTSVAAAIKTADPSASVLGPSGWGYCEWVASGSDGCGPGADSAAHGGLNFSQWYLKNMKSVSDSRGTRLLDYYDEHYYPAIDSGTDAAANALRLRSTRSLWDPTYVDESWIGPKGVNAPPLQVIRTMKSWVAQYYPGTKVAMTEYNWGALDNINGALAQADVLGIFGREGLDLATIWGEPQPAQPGAYAFRMYRNYDGKGSRFGDVSVSASSGDQGQLAVYAASRSSDKATTIMVVNKTDSPLAWPLKVAGCNIRGPVQSYTYSPANLNAIVRSDGASVRGNTVNTTYPANSITLLVLPSHGR